MGVRIPDPQVIKISQQDLWKYKDAYLKAGEKVEHLLGFIIMKMVVLMKSGHITKRT